MADSQQQPRPTAPSAAASPAEPTLPPVEAYGRRMASTETVKRWRFEQRALTVVKSLQKNGFEAMYLADAAQVREAILDRVAAEAVVGVGGSLTIRQTGVLDALRAGDHTVHDHWRAGLSEEEALDVRRAQLTSDVFLTSVNAVTLEGQMICTDGIGNRLAALTFGPKKVIVVVGAQKIVNDVEAGRARVRDVCGPLALKETGAKTPCAREGICGECGAQTRMCRATLILDCRPLCTETTVIIVGEELGF